MLRTDKNYRLFYQNCQRVTRHHLRSRHLIRCSISSAVKAVSGWLIIIWDPDIWYYQNCKRVTRHHLRRRRLIRRNPSCITNSFRLDSDATIYNMVILSVHWMNSFRLDSEATINNHNGRVITLVAPALSKITSMVRVIMLVAPTLEMRNPVYDRWKSSGHINHIIGENHWSYSSCCRWKSPSW